MAITEQIKIVIDTVAGNAARDIKSFTSSIREAEGLTGKFKAGVKSAGEFVQNNLGLSLTAVGSTAIGVGKQLFDFAQESVSAFQDLALEAGKLSDATGLAVDEASRWMEVAGDVDISTGDLESTFGRLAREIGNNPAKFQELGVAVRDAETGTLDMNASILAAIDLLNRTKDPAERAALAQELFGRSWQNIAELINQGAPEVRASLESVGDAKVIDDRELERARDLRGVLDNLRDAAEEFSLEIGGTLVPLVTDMGFAIIGAKDAIEELIAVIPDIPEPPSGWFDWIKGIPGVSSLAMPVELAGDAFRYLSERGREASGVMEDVEHTTSPAAQGMVAVREAAAKAAEAEEEAAEQAAAYADQLTELAEAAGLITEAFQELPDAIDAAEEAAGEFTAAVAEFNKEPTEQTLRKVEKAAADAAIKEVDLARAQAQANGATLTQVQALDLQNRKLLDQAATLNGPARRAILDRIAQLNGIPPEKITRIEALLDRGRIEEANREINDASRNRRAAIQADVVGLEEVERKLTFTARERQVFFRGTVRGGPIAAAQGGVARFANGGVALVGERGPELVGLPNGSQVIPAERLENLFRQEMNRVINNNVQLSINGGWRDDRQLEQDVVRALRARRRYRGPIVMGRTL